MRPRRFAILDRDGTIIVERHYLSAPEQVELLPGAVRGLRKLSQLGVGLVVVTNQSAVGRGYFDEKRLDLIHRRLAELLTAEAVPPMPIYVCPHRPDAGCRCRKPLPGLLEQAARDLGFDVSSSFVIGDKACDIELGKQVMATTLLVRTGYGAELAQTGSVSPDYVVDDLAQAAETIESLLLKTTNRTVAAHIGDLPAVDTGMLRQVRSCS
jgi:D-glycero-D-manno-heptose 1,7-bisphosphate phosphatase